MYFVILIWSSFHRVSACNSKNKLAVEVGEGFFKTFFKKPLMPINVGTHRWEMWGPGAYMS